MAPDEHTLQEFFLEVGNGHELYVQDWGNPQAESPIIFLHGGPGSSSKDKHRGVFEPEQHRVIFFDQRGCGRSIPYGSLEHNTTTDLIEDISKIADKIGLDTFVLQGGSWGSCLAFAYAIAHPKRVQAMVLQGIFTGSRSEIDHLDKGGFRTFFPDVWDCYLEVTPKAHRSNPSRYHIARILGDNPAHAIESGFIYESLEGSLMSIDDRFSPRSTEDFDIAGIRTEVHYMHNRCFMEDRYIIKNAHALKMPIWLIQGRYDMVCPPNTAYELHQILPQSKLIMTMAGHGGDRSNYDAMHTALLQFK